METVLIRSFEEDHTIKNYFTSFGYYDRGNNTELRVFYPYLIKGAGFPVSFLSDKILEEGLWYFNLPRGGIHSFEYDGESFEEAFRRYVERMKRFDIEVL